MPHSIHTKRLTPPRARLLTAAALLSVALALAGCGGSLEPRPSPISPSAKERPASASPGGGGSSPESPASLQQEAIAYAKCMRSNGVPNFPDPNAGGGFLFHASAGIDPSSPAFKAAQAKCRSSCRAAAPARPTPSPQTLAQFLKIARCMRQHGVSDFPDPRTSVPSNPFGSAARVISDIEGVILVFPSTIDQQSPAFTRAAAACAFPLHNH